MNVIKFSHDYPKLKGETKARLLLCITDISYDLLSKKWLDFMLYDIYIGNGEFYYLSSYDKYMVLVFLGVCGNLFTTIRKDTEENREKYSDKIGIVFNLQIGGENEKFE